MEQETDPEIDRHPRQIEKGDRPGSGKKAAHHIEIADRLGAVAFRADLERQPHDRVVNPQTHRLVEAMTDPHQNAAPDHIDEALSGVEPGDQE